MIGAKPRPLVSTDAGCLHQNFAYRISREDHFVPTVDETIAQAKVHHNAGERSQAALLDQQVVAADSANVEAHFLLGAARHGLSQPQEAIAIRPRVIDVVTVQRGETVQSLSQRMAYSGFKLERFRSLNGLSASTELTPGQKVKLIVYGSRRS